MNIGIIVEYNPFHNGHKYHIDKTRELFKAKNIIAVMSGNFVQRGEPAIINKFERTKAALLNGVDMVLELPTIYSTSAADVFSYGGIDILNKTGIIDGICFGSEAGSLETIKKVSEILYNESEDFKKFLAYELSLGISYPKARLNTVSKILNEDLSILSLPNNILALEYLKALKLTKSKISPLTIQRKTADFHSTAINAEIASATAIRKAICDNLINDIYKAIPSNTHTLFKDKNDYINLDDFSQIFHYLLRTKSLDELKEIADITEGLENRIKKFSNHDLISEIISQIKTKRYTYTKLQRGLLHIILDIKKSDIASNKANPYIRVLGFKKSSASLLKELTEKACVPVLTNLKNAEKQLNPEAMAFLNREIKFTDIYNLVGNKKLSEDYTHPLVII